MRYLLIILIFVGVSSLKSQDYENAFGVRFGQSWGLSFKHFLTPDKAFEGILSTRYQGYLLTGLFEIQKPFHEATLSKTSLSYYYGIGGHVGSFRANNGVGNVNEGFTTLGVNLIGGLEYQFISIPFNASLDLMPFWSLNSYYWQQARFLDLALTVRYIIN